MRLRKLQFEGITRFRSPVEVDFDALGPGLVGIVGGNGFGKTTILECSGPAALFRELPTRPNSALANWVGPDGGSLDLAFESGGHEYKSELRYFTTPHTAVLYVDGVPVTTGKLRDYDAAIAERFGTPAMFYVSAFAAQGGRGRFAALNVSDRKSLFRFYLGLDRIESIHASAKARLAKIDVAKIDRLHKEADAIESRVSDIEAMAVRARENLIAKTIARDDAAKLHAELSVSAALSAAVAAYQRALRDVLAAEDRLTVAKAALPAPAPVWIQARQGLRADALRAALEESHKSAAEVTAARAVLIDAHRQATDASTRAGLLATVPCRGGLAFASCGFLCEAIKASRILARLEDDVVDAGGVLKDAEDAHVAVPIAEVRDAETAYAEAVRQARLSEKAAELVTLAQGALRDAKRRAIELRKSLPDVIPDVPTQETIDEAEACSLLAQRDVDTAVSALATIEAHLASTIAQVAALRKEADDDKAWAENGNALTVLVRGFGPNGIQALEIDSAGPKLSTLANELLSACYGDRFQIEVRTQRDLKTRGGIAEDFAIHVTDAERGRSGDIASLSGGEQVIVDEALRTALALFQVESRGGVRTETLWRDETTAALYGDNIPRYLSMLRKARVLGGFHQIVFVGGEEAADAADAVIRVRADGVVTGARR